jgi:putative redox protein
MDNPAKAPAGFSPVVVRNVPGMHLAQSITVDGHEIRADEPEALGGGGTGPTPHALLLAALGTCTAMTLRLYAERKGWEIGNLTVGLSIRWEKAEGSADKRVVIERIIESDRALTPEQQARLVDIAEKCPVHRTLMGDKIVTTRLAGPIAEV